MPNSDNALNPATTCVIMIDMQNDFISDGGAASKRGSDLSLIRGMIPQLAKFIDNARRIGCKIIFVRGEYGLDTSSPAWERRPSAKKDREDGFRMCEPGTWGVQIIDQLKPTKDDIVVVKHRHSAFHGTSLEAHLRMRHTEKLVFTGIMTNVCVESSVRDGFNRDYDVIVAEDCVAAADINLHAASLKTIARHIGTVATSEEIITRLTL